jgi:hypothetical protein
MSYLDVRSLMMRFSFLWVALLCVACGADHERDDDNHQTADAGVGVDDGAGVDAGSGLSADVYVAGMEQVGADGVFRVALIDSSPIPQDLTLYTWLIEVRDADGNPVEGAAVVAEPTMPDHGHGTFPITTPGVAAEGVGRFTLSDMDLFMAGVWRVELRVSAGDLTDTIRFHFALDS